MNTTGISPTGRRPSRAEVAFWAVVRSGGIVILAMAVPTDRPGRIFLVAPAVGLVARVVVPALRRSRRGSQEPPHDATLVDRPPPPPPPRRHA